MTDKLVWADYRPSKALWLWSCLGSVIATLAIGFTWGGWITERTANRMVAEATDDGRATLAAAVCVDRFLGGSDAASKLAELKTKSSWQRVNYVKEGGWMTFDRVERPIEGGAERCASKLAEIEVSAEGDLIAGGATDATEN